MKKSLAAIFSIPLWQQIIIGLLLGMLLGFVSPEIAVSLAPGGQIFIQAIQLMVVPVVFVSITCGVLSLRETAAMGRVTFKTISLYIITMLIAGTIGIVVAQIAEPGKGVDLTHLLEGTPDVEAVKPTFETFFLNLVPSNMFAAFSTNSLILQVIVIGIILGLSIMRAGEKGKRIHHLFNDMFSVMMQFALIIMRFAPIGIFCLMAVVVGKFGSDILVELLAFVLTVYAGCLIQALVVYSGILAFVARLNPLRFFRGMADAMVFAFSTTSGAATLPVALRCTQEKLGAAQSISEFVLPLGISINMNGLTLYLSVAAVFAANLYGIELTFVEMVIIVITATIASMGASGVPGSALFVMAIVMGSIGVPIAVISIIAAVDRIIDMMTTTTNVTGDAMVTVVVAESEGMLDKDVYNGKRAS